MTPLCPGIDCCCWKSESSHSPLPESWERLVAPCRCSFMENSTGGYKEDYVNSDGLRIAKRRPSGKSRSCSLRVLYINHMTGEATLHCPCETCSPEWKGVPCNTLGMLFGEDEPVLLEENGDPLIPAQDLTRVGKPCWRLGDLFDEVGTESLELDDDPIIPAQDVGLHIFDDMHGFAIARNHLDLTAQDPPLVARISEPQSVAVTPPYPGLQTSPSIVVSKTSFFSFFVPHTIKRSTYSTHDVRFPFYVK